MHHCADYATGRLTWNRELLQRCSVSSRTLSDCIQTRISQDFTSIQRKIRKLITCSHSATFKPCVDWQISFPVVVTVLQAPSGNHFQHKLSVLESYYANRKWFLPLTRPPSSPPPSRESSHSSLGAVSPAVTGRIGPSELSHLGAPSHRRWMAGSGQSDVEPLHQERRPWSWMLLGRMHVHGDHLPSRSSAHRGCDRTHQKPSCSSQTSRPCCAANKGVFSEANPTRTSGIKSLWSKGHRMPQE